LTGHLDDRDVVAVNMIVVGVAPDRQTWRSRNTRVRVSVDGRDVHDGAVTAVVIANGQYLRTRDVVPRGHPGDGRVEMHVYTLRRAERRAMRARLAIGAHLPHPRIATASGRRVVVESASGPIPVEVDGAGHGRAARVDVEVTPGAFSLLV
jgi:diacylglycerol kinase family enzyme